MLFVGNKFSTKKEMKTRLFQIALNYLLKTYGYNAAGVFADKLQEEIYSKQSKGKSAYDQRLISYFQSDDE